MRDGAADDFLAYAAKAGRLTLAQTPDEARAALLADWHTTHQHEPDSLMIAYRRIDVETLNHAARTLLRQEIDSMPDRHTTPEGRGFAIGDQVICLHNAPTLGVANGTRGHLIDVREDGLTLRTAAGDRRLPARYADEGNLAHGYAITGHKSQGQTVARAFVLAPDRGDLKEWAYVATSRARDETRIYLAEASLDYEHEPPAAPAPGGDALERFATAAARPANERLATDPPREPVAHLVERRDALQRDLARAQRTERDTERVLGKLGPIRRHTRGPRLTFALEDARHHVVSLGTEIATLERAISARQIEITERVRARGLEARTLPRTARPQRRRRSQYRSLRLYLEPAAHRDLELLQLA